MFKYKSPVALPQLTTDKFEESRQRYTAEHGYKIFIPGFEDIVKWNKHDEPTLEELELKKSADKSNTRAKTYIERLGQARWDELLTLAPGDPNWYTYLESHNYNTALEALEDRNRIIQELGEKKVLRDPGD